MIRSNRKAGKIKIKIVPDIESLSKNPQQQSRRFYTG